jgi:hypothetical protein
MFEISCVTLVSKFGFLIYIYSVLSYTLRDCLTCGLICGTSVCSAFRYVVDSGNSQFSNSFPLIHEKANQLASVCLLVCHIHNHECRY